MHYEQTTLPIHPQNSSLYGMHISFQEAVTDGLQPLEGEGAFQVFWPPLRSCIRFPYDVLNINILEIKNDWWNRG
jgi:hypothetical protein